MSFRFTCPDSTINKEERILILKNQIEKWFVNDSIQPLFRAADFPIFKAGDNINNYLPGLMTYIKKWDYRDAARKKQQLTHAERYEIEDDSFSIAHRNEIFKVAFDMGLMDITTPRISDPDYICPMGGARMSNYDRPRKAKEITDSLQNKNTKVVALSGNRPIDLNIEKDSILQYAPNAKTEFEAISTALEHLFETTLLSEIANKTDSQNEYSNIKKYMPVNARGLYSLCAPSSQPALRRANTLDTIDYFMVRFNIERGTRVLLVTSSIYVNSLSLTVMSRAIENGIVIDCVGDSNTNIDEVINDPLRKPCNYLQELKSIIDSMSTLLRMYK